MQSSITPSIRFQAKHGNVKLAKHSNPTQASRQASRWPSFKFAKSLQAISQFKLQYIQKSIASKVTSTQSNYNIERIKQVLLLYKRSSSDCVQVQKSTMMQSMIQKSKERTNARQKPKLLKASQTKRDEQDPTPPRNRSKGFSSRGLVRISASWSSVSTWITSTNPSHTDPLGSGSEYQYVWIWSVDKGFC